MAYSVATKPSMSFDTMVASLASSARRASNSGFRLTDDSGILYMLSIQWPRRPRCAASLVKSVFN